MKAWNWLLGNLMILTTGCGMGVVHTPMQNDSGPQGSLSFLMIANPMDDVGLFRFDFEGNGTTETVYQGLNTGTLPAHLLPEGASETHNFADAYIVLSVGTYLVTVTPMQNEVDESTMCQKVQTSVEVAADVTTDVFLVAPCKSDENGGVDVVVTTNHYPDITGLVFSPGDKVAACENVQVKVEVEDVDGDETTLVGQITSQPDGAEPQLAEIASGFTFVSETPGKYDVQLSVCDSFELCSDLTFPITVLSSADSNQNGIDDACEPDLGKMGRVVTILLTMSNQRILADFAGVSTKLITNAIDWVNPSANTARVLVVLDDGNNGEYPEDANFVLANLLQGYDVTLIEEPVDGLLPEDLLVDDEIVDVVWFCNPGYQIDDLTTIETLSAFAESGGGVVLQGDDMSWRQEAIGLTHLEFVSNGTRNCGKVTDNDRGASYLVDIVPETHPVIQELEGTIFPYGDDIDVSNAIGKGEKVLAWTSRIDSTCPCEFEPRPVIIALDLEEINAP